MIRIFLLAILTAGLLLSGCTGDSLTDDAQTTTTAAEKEAAADSLKSVLVAKVVDQEISREDFEMAYKYLPQKAVPIINQRGPEYLLDMLIEFELFYLEALDRKMNMDPEIQGQIDRMVRQFYYQALLMKDAPQDFEVTEQEANDFFETNKDNFRAAARARSAQIITRDQAAAQKAYDQAKAGENFEKLVLQYSDDPTKETNKGDMGWRQKGELLPELDEAIFSGKEGDIVGPVQSSIGFHVILIVGKKPAGLVDFEEVSEKVKNQIKQQKADQWRQEYTDKLKEKFSVTKYPENLPTQ